MNVSTCLKHQISHLLVVSLNSALKHWPTIRFGAFRIVQMTRMVDWSREYHSLSMGLSSIAAVARSSDVARLRITRIQIAQVSLYKRLHGVFRSHIGATQLDILRCSNVIGAAFPCKTFIYPIF